MKAGSYFAAGRSTGRSTIYSTKIAALRPHGFYVYVRVIAFMFIHTQHASKIAWHSVALLVEIQRKLKYVQLGAACGKIGTNQANSLILLFVRPAAKYESTLTRVFLIHLC